MSLAAGARLGAYEILTLLGAGGMGEVYRARDARLGRDVAIKVIPAAFSADPDRLQRFEQEARATATLNHPNILAVYDVGSHEGSPFIVSELLEGETLRERLSAGALPVRKAIELGIQIADALAAAHEKGIVHRDLKPENIFINKDGRAKILDFGLAKLTQPEGAVAATSNLPTTPVQTQHGMVLGTLGYMAPEQVRGLPVDHRADIFALGAVLYEMLGGRRAFAGGTSADTISAILKEDPADLPVDERHIPPALTRIVDRCLEKNPPARFGTAADLAFALRGLSSISHSDRAAVAVAEPRSTAPTAARRVWIAAGLATALLFAAGVALFLYLRQPRDERLISRLELVTQPTPDPLSFALSLDGRQIVYAGYGATGSRVLWVRRFDQAAARPLTGTDGGSYPFWSPDGDAIGFFADAKLKRVDLAGGAVQTLAPAPAGRGGSWNRDGVILFATDTVGGLMRVPESGGTSSVVTRPTAAENSHRWPQFLPDGQRFIFGVALGRLETRGTYLGSLDGRPHTQLLSDDVPAIYAPGVLLVVRQGTLMALKFDEATLAVSDQPVTVSHDVGSDPILYRAGLTVSANGVLAQRAIVNQRRQLVWMDRSGREVGAVADAEDTGVSGPGLSPDGQRIGVTRSVERNIDIWIYDVARALPDRFTFHMANDTYPVVWSPDGRQVVFRSNRSGPYDLFVKPANASADEQVLIASSENKAAGSWSLDGRVLLYSSLNSETGSDIWALPLTGDKKPFVVLRTPFHEMNPQFSPDGKWMAYVSTESGRPEAYVRGFPGPGGRIQLSTGGGTQLQWRPDGKEIFFVTSDGRFMAVPISMAPDGQGLRPGVPVPLFSTRLASGGNINLATYALASQYAVTRDGRFVLNVAAEGETAPPISIVLNWDAVLQRQ